MRYNKWVGTGVALLGASLLSGVCPAVAVANEKLQALDSIIDNGRRNLSRIEWWQGKANLREKSSVEGVDGAEAQSIRAITFYFSRESNTVRNRWVTKSSPQMMRKGGAIEQMPDVELISNRMTVPGALLWLNDIPVDKNETSPRLLIVRAPPRGSERDQVFFDPRSCFFDSSKLHPSEVMAILRPLFADGARDGAGIERDGDLVSVNVNSAQSLNRYTFDIERSGVLVEFRAESIGGRLPQPKQVITIGYTSTDGVYTPSKWISHLETRTVDGREAVSDREILFTETSINKAIAAEEFSVDALGLRKGDWIRDDRTGTKTRYTGKFEVEPTSRPTTAPTTRGRQPTSGSGASSLGSLYWLGLLSIPLLFPVWTKTFWNPSASRRVSMARWWIPRCVGALLFVGGLARLGDQASLKNVLAFDGFPGWALAPLSLSVLLFEMLLGQGLIVGWGRRALWACAAVLTVYCFQLIYLLLFENAPDCGCAFLVKAFDDAWTSHIVGLIRNVLLIGATLYCLRGQGKAAPEVFGGGQPEAQLV